MSSVEIATAAMVATSPDAVSAASSGSPIHSPSTSPSLEHPQAGGEETANVDSDKEQKRKDHFPQRVVQPSTFEPSDHFYPRALNAQIHPTVRKFLVMSNEQRIRRFCHTHAEVSYEHLMGFINSFKPKHLMWSGTDLMSVTEKETGMSFMTVIELNTCASGQKSSPLFDENIEEGGYGKLLKRCFWPELQRRAEAGMILEEGALGVIYDKNFMEASGYAASMADVSGESVHLLPMWDEEKWGEGVTEWKDDILYIKETQTPIRAVFRYVTQQPWKKIPVSLPTGHPSGTDGSVRKKSTFVCNPISACLAGGRNKMVAAKAFETFNPELDMLSVPMIRTPRTIRDVKFEEVRRWIDRMGGYGCIKIPYKNAGQGVYTITNANELDEFETQEKDNPYSLFIIQSLIANSKWSSSATAQRGGSTLFHNGTVPNKKGQIYVADLRLQVAGHPIEGGFEPISMYARRAAKPLDDTITPESDSWSQLGTNLSVGLGNGLFASESGRLLMMDRKDFDTLGLSLDALIDAYVQACLSHVAVDRQAEWLYHGKDQFSLVFFRSVCDDAHLIEEVKKGIALNKCDGSEEK